MVWSADSTAAFLLAMNKGIGGAGPGPISCLFNKLSADWVMLDIGDGGLKVIVRVNWAREVPALPEVAASSIFTIEILRIFEGDAVDPNTQAVVRWHRQDVKMIRH